MNWIHRNLLRFQFYRNWVEKTKKIYIPFLDSISLYEFLVVFFQEVQKENIFLKSSALAYQFLLAIFPGLIFLLTLIAFIPIPNFQQNVMKLFLNILPSNVYDAAEGTLNDVVIRKNGGLLSFGFLATLYFSTSGMATLIASFHKSSDKKDTRTFLGKRILASFLTVCLTILLLIAGLVRFAGNWVLKSLTDKEYIHKTLENASLNLLQIIMVALLFYIGIAFLYYFGPYKRLNRPFFTLGAAMASLAALATTEGFTFYVSHFGRYNKIYGSLGTLIVLMGLLYLNSCILLIGYDIELSIAACKEIMQMRKSLHPLSFDSKPIPRKGPGNQIRS